MKKSYLCIVALAAVPSAIATAAQYHHIAGAACQPSGNVYDSNLVVDVMLNSYRTTQITVGCPVELTSTSVSPVTVNPSGLRVDYWDGNPDPSYGAVGCEFMMRTSTGTIVTSPWRYSCATAGGCDTVDGYWGYGGYMTWADTLGATANVVAQGFYCSIPGLISGYPTSGIVGVALATSAP